MSKKPQMKHVLAIWPFFFSSKEFLKIAQGWWKEIISGCNLYQPGAEAGNAMLSQLLPQHYSCGDGMGGLAQARTRCIPLPIITKCQKCLKVVRTSQNLSTHTEEDMLIYTHTHTFLDAKPSQSSGTTGVTSAIICGLIAIFSLSVPFFHACVVHLHAIVMAVFGNYCRVSHT